MISAQEIVNEIEFELLQGVVRQGELGTAIQEIAAFQAESRRLLAEQVTHPQENSDLAIRQAHFNDMTLTLLGEMGQNLAGLKEQQTAMWAWLKDRTVPRSPAEAESLPIPLARLGFAQEKTSEFQKATAMYGLSDYPLESRSIEQAMDRDVLQVDVDVRPSSIPLFGGLLNRVRRALHNLVYFYVLRIAQAQTKVNHTYGEHLLALIQRDAAATQRQEELGQLIAYLSQPADPSQ